MRNSNTQPVDAIAELRLRLWARTNYVPAAIRRDSEWHPVVLEEMRRKDVDLRMQNGESPMTKVVPIMPELPGGLRIDAAQEPSLAPHAFQNIDMAVPFYA